MQAARPRPDRRLPHPGPARPDRPVPDPRPARLSRTCAIRSSCRSRCRSSRQAANIWAAIRGPRHPGASSLRVVRPRRRFHRGGGRRRPRAGHQADALPHQQRFADRPGAAAGGRQRQAGDRRHRAEGPARRGAQHPLGARAGEGRRPRRLRLRRPEDALQGRPGRAPRGRRHPPLRPPGHRQLQPADGPHLHRPRLLHLQPRLLRGRLGPVQLPDRLLRAAAVAQAGRRARAGCRRS